MRRRMSSGIGGNYRVAVTARCMVDTPFREGAPTPIWSLRSRVLRLTTGRASDRPAENTASDGRGVPRTVVLGSRTDCSQQGVRRFPDTDESLPAGDREVPVAVRHRRRPGESRSYWARPPLRLRDGRGVFLTIPSSRSLPSEFGEEKRGVLAGLCSVPLLSLFGASVTHDRFPDAEFDGDEHFIFDLSRSIYGLILGA